jgi:hypothetical protein
MRALIRLRLLLPAFLAIAVFVWKAPHLGLLARVAAGDLDGKPVPVSEFTPGQWSEGSVALPVGLLVVDIPRALASTLAEQTNAEGIRLKGEGLTCWLSSPRREPARVEVYGDIPGRVLCPGGDEAASVAAAWRDLSFWMDAKQVRSLAARLAVKSFCAMPAERVEVVRTGSVIGLLVLRHLSDGRTSLNFDYSSPDGSMRGLAVFMVDEGSATAMNLARALVSSMRLTHG